MSQIQPIKMRVIWLSSGCCRCIQKSFDLSTQNCFNYYQLTCTRSNSTIETVEKGVKYVQS